MFLPHHSAQSLCFVFFKLALLTFSSIQKRFVISGNT